MIIQIPCMTALIRLKKANLTRKPNSLNQMWKQQYFRKLEQPGTVSFLRVIYELTWQACYSSKSFQGELLQLL